MAKIHVDTDLGGDIDDLCALAMLLGWPDVDLTGITVVGDTKGKRTGYVRYVLALDGRSDIPVAAGADTSLGCYRLDLTLPAEERYWPEPVPASPNPPEAAIELLKRSIEQGATIVGIGPFTNLYLLDMQNPGILLEANLVLMGGYVHPPRAGFPKWGNQDDFNVQVDVMSARHVFANSTPTLVTLAVTAETALRTSDVERLRGSGALGRLLARQAEAFAEDEKMAARFGATCAEVPADIINFHHDPLACAIAVGWRNGVEIAELPLIIEEREGWLVERIDDSGRPFKVVAKVDGQRFNDFWIDVTTKVSRA